MCDDDDFKYWLVTGSFEGEVRYYEEGVNFPKTGVTQIFDFFTIIQESPLNEKFELKIKVESSLDHVQIATKVCERILESILFGAGIPCRIAGLSMKEVQPEDLEKNNYLDASEFETGDYWEPYVHGEYRANLVYFGRSGGWNYLNPDIVSNIRLKWDSLNKLTAADSLTISAIDYYKRGMQLEFIFPSEAYLNFYKIIELYINSKFKDEYIKEIIDQIGSQFKSWYKQYCPTLQNREIIARIKEIASSMVINEKLLQYLCETTGFYETYSDPLTKELSPKLTKRRVDIAHPNLSREEIERHALLICKNLAKHLIELEGL